VIFVRAAAQRLEEQEVLFRPFHEVLFLIGPEKSERPPLLNVLFII